MGRKPSGEPRASFRLSLSRTAHETLEALVREGYSGRTVPEAAGRILEGALRIEQTEFDKRVSRRIHGAAIGWPPKGEEP